MIGVYIARNPAGDVLYVGSSGDIDKRLEEHRRAGSEWWAEHASIETRPATSRALAFHLERELIQTLNPKHNTVGRGAKNTSRAVGPVVKPRPEGWACVIDAFGSVAALARAIGCDHMTVSTIWRGAAYPSGKVIARLVVVSGIPFDELFYVDPGDAPASEWMAKRPGRARKKVEAAA